MKARGIEVDMEQRFLCESDPEELEWCMRVNPDPQCCAFTNIEHLHRKKAWCARHEQECEVQRSEGAILGTSCKDMSPASSNKAAMGNTLSADATSKGTSHRTFRAMLLWVDVYGPEWVI